MFKSVLLRKTIILLLAALIASAAFTTLAFVVAGRSATYSTQVDKASSQTRSLAEFFSESPELLKNEKITDALFSDTSVTGRGICLFTKDGTPIYRPSNPDHSDETFFNAAICWMVK